MSPRSDLTSDLKSMAQTAYDLTFVLFVLSSVRPLFELCVRSLIDGSS